MRIFFSAGEASGDAYAAELVRALQRQIPELDLSAPRLEFEDAEWQAKMRDEPDEFVYEVEQVLSDSHKRLASSGRLRGSGIGGPKLRAALRHDLVADSSRWGAMSIIQSLKVAPLAYRGFKKAKKALSHGEPGLFVPIDFGFFNIRLARFAKSKGWKVLYFIPPGSWRKDRQGKDLPEVANAVVTPFPWSAEMLSQMGANAHWYGHPLKQMSRESGPPWEQATRKTIAALPGSRDHEIEHNLPLIAEALDLVHSDLPVEFAVAQNLSPEDLERRWKELAPHRKSDLFVQDEVFAVLGRARAAIVCSGTATLQAALRRCPCVVIYRVSPMMELEARLLRIRPEFIALPNILLSRMALPELIQHDATPGRVADWLNRLLEDGDEREDQLAAYEELDELLGPDDCLDRTAELMKQMLGGA
jgi:lipid-A-disaccharide synthase